MSRKFNLLYLNYLRRSNQNVTTKGGKETLYTGDLNNPLHPFITLFVRTNTHSTPADKTNVAKNGDGEEKYQSSRDCRV